MKKIVVAIMVLSMMFAAMAAMAQGEKNFTITPRIAVNFATQKDSLGNKQGNQYGILADLNWATCPVGFEIGWLGSSTKNSQTISVTEGDTEATLKADVKVKTTDIPILVTYDYDFNDAFYASVGAGITFKTTRLAADNGWVRVTEEDESVYTGGWPYESEKQTKTHFAWQAGFGYKFANNWSAELFYYDQGKTRFNKGEGKGNDYYDYKGSYIQLNVGYSF